ncbi:MAG TPA: metallophosphoesterase family protein [Spirochaetota bacterium]|nr:metallophosphoesterase family protein [Spirochaetota bacterium]HPS86899.1 metallophosphoesterase family protein [Spirochaetota bacterium]
MLIGIFSDTHNDIEEMQKAISIFREKNVKILIHAGDITSPRMLEYLKDFDCYVVLGNGDLIDSEDINLKAASLGMRPVEDKIEFECGGKNFLVFHGHNVPMYREAVASGKYNYIIKGHTHHFENYISNGCRIINPGAVYGHDESSIAILDTDADKVEKIDLEEI